MSCPTKADAIVIGGGHNGLVCAALLAQKGRKTVLLESQSEWGGIAATHSIADGFDCPGVLHDTSRIRPAVIKSLALTRRHGLALAERPAVAVPRSGQSPLVLDGDTCHGASESDATAFRLFREIIQRYAKVFSRVVDTEPPNITGSKVTGLWDAMLTGWALRKLGSDALYEFLRLPPMPVQDWMAELFQDDALRAAVAFPIAIGGHVGPRAPGTAASLLLEECTSSKAVVGGPAALIRSLVSACEHHNVSMHTNSTVESVLCDGGRVSGVVLKDGTSVEAPVVVATCDPKTTFGSLIPAPVVGPRLMDAITNFRARGTVAKVNLAVRGEFAIEGVSDPAVRTLRMVQGMDGLERASDTLKYGSWTSQPPMEAQAYAASGDTDGHVLSVLIGFVSHDPATLWTDEDRDRLADESIERLATCLPDLASRVVARTVLTPTDLVERYGLSSGHPYQGEHALDQLLFMRPASDCPNHTTPIHGLYLGGSGTHPGGGLTGAPGRLAANAVL